MEPSVHWPSEPDCGLPLLHSIGATVSSITWALPVLLIFHLGRRCGRSEGPRWAVETEMKSSRASSIAASAMILVASFEAFEWGARHWGKHWVSNNYCSECERADNVNFVFILCFAHKRFPNMSVSQSEREHA